MTKKDIKLSVLPEEVTEDGLKIPHFLAWHRDCIFNK